jgi:hypothetical protein
MIEGMTKECFQVVPQSSDQTDSFKHSQSRQKVMLGCFFLGRVFSEFIKINK